MLKKLPFPFPNDKSIRVIYDTDCYCECDDQFAIVHALLTPRFDVKAVIAAHFMKFPPAAEENSEQESYDELVNITVLMGIRDEVNILHGAASTLPDEHTAISSEGARFIIEEAMRDDPRPLFVANCGAVTNLASAYLMEPAIKDKLTAIWIGGKPYPNGGFEYNQNGDINAARVLLKSDLELWQVPASTYRMMRVSYFELMNKVYPYGKIGRYLVKNSMRVGENMVKTISMAKNSGAFDGMSKGDRGTSHCSEMWILGDSPTIGLMLTNECGKYHEQPAPGDLLDDGGYDFAKPGSRNIRVYDDIDSHFIMNDFEAKLRYYFGS